MNPRPEYEKQGWPILPRAWKFRSMIPNAENGKAVWAEEKDPRVTRVGRLMRATHVDEFPQFLNILKACPEPCPELRRRVAEGGQGEGDKSLP